MQTVVYLSVKLALLLGLQSSALCCQDNCLSCSRNLQTCEQCKDGYWLDGRRSCRRCPDKCEKCTNATYCTTCKAGFYTESTCASPCPQICDTSGCERKGYCYGCPRGFYGPYCQYSCNLCRNGSCGLRQCTYGCIDGYTEENGQCVKCHINCKLCKRQGYCLECNKGFYRHPYVSGNGNNSFYCVSCISVCEECSSVTDCIKCKPGNYGKTCEFTCSELYCHMCNETEGGDKCTECISGYRLNGTVCVPQNVCSQNCANGCDMNSECSGGCKDGWTGKTCSDHCKARCQRCDQSDWRMCTLCKGDSYTTSCNVNCSSECSRIPGQQTCGLSDGHCLNKCIHGYMGDNCNLTVSSGITKNASESSTPKLNGGKAENVDQEDNNVIIVAGAAGGMVIISAAVIVIVFVLIRRQRKKSDAVESEKQHREDNLQNVQMDADNIYAKPNKPVKEQDEDYIYAQPNKPKKKSHHSKKEISEPKSLYDNVAIDLDAGADTRKEARNDHDHAESGDVITEETDIDAVLLENIDDEPKSVIVTEVNIPTSDTYYNMASLVRSRVQITSLLEYTKNKSDFEREFENLPQGLTRTCNEALKPQNRAKNRYNGIYAYDATRVVLQSKSFINANYIEGYSQSQVYYIASLGPTRSTMNNFETFWEMVWQEKTNKIIMLTNLKENKKMKCEQYWPEQGNRAVFGDISLLCTAEKMYSDFVVREFSLKKMSETREVTQYHYTAWPDKTVPSAVASLIEFRDKVEEEETPVTGPIVVHCSAGIGRTGTYIALDTLIREGREEDSVDIFGCVIALRGQRVKMVQNVEQYVFLHHCVLYALTCYPHSLPLTAVPHIMTDEKISTQYQAFVDIQLSRNRDVRPMTKTTSRKENRKGADIPGEDNRVKLTLTKHDYINAVYVNGYKKIEKYIIAQTPLPNTVADFVSMLYQERCPCVVCLDPENIKNKTVESYIPPANKVSTFGRFQVECLRSDSMKHFTVRELKISRIGSPRLKELQVQHYQFKGWNNSNSVPADFQPFLNIIRNVENNETRQQTEGPIVVHCVTGAERSSLFCVISILLEKCTTEKELSVLNTVCQVRSRRQSAIPDIGQLRFCYDCVTEILEMSDADAYCNISNV